MVIDRKPFLKFDDLDGFLFKVAAIGMLIHVVIFAAILSVFPSLYERLMDDYLLRFLDPLWWMVWFLGMFASVKSGMFDYWRYSGIVAGSIIFAFVGGLLTTIVWGLPYGAAILFIAFSTTGVCILLNKMRDRKDKKATPSE